MEREETVLGDIQAFFCLQDRGNKVQRSMAQILHIKQEWRSLPPGRGLHLESHVLKGTQAQGTVGLGVGEQVSCPTL